MLRSVAPPVAHVHPNRSRHERFAQCRHRSAGAATFPGHDVHRPRAAQVFRLHAARHRAVLRVAGPSRRAGLRDVRGRARRRHPAHRRRRDPRRLARARARADRRHVGARRQRLALHVAERRLGIPRVLDDRAPRAGAARRRRVRVPRVGAPSPRGCRPGAWSSPALSIRIVAQPHVPSTGENHEALLLPRRVLARAAHRPRRSRRAVHRGQGRPRARTSSPTAPTTTRSIRRATCRCSSSKAASGCRKSR